MLVIRGIVIRVLPARMELIDAKDTVDLITPLLNQHVIETFLIRDRRRLLARLCA